MKRNDKRLKDANALIQIFQAPKAGLDCKEAGIAPSAKRLEVAGMISYEKGIAKITDEGEVTAETIAGELGEG